MKRPSAVAAFALVALAALPAAAAAPPHAGDTAPAFSLPKVDGGTLSLAKLSGKPVYLNFFASWCGPCNDEAPSVASLYRKYKTRGLVTLGVDEQEDGGKAKGFIDKYKLPYPVVLDDGAMGKDYGAIALPIHVFIDRHGKVSTYRLGQMDPGEIEDAIKKIL